MIRIEITETGRNSLKENASTFNHEEKILNSVEDVKAYLIERYGKIPNGKNKIYRHKKDGSVVEVGFLHSYWNDDCSHNAKKWYQTDWISFETVNFQPFDIKQLY